MAEEALAFSTRDKHANYFRIASCALPLRSFYLDYDWRLKHKCHGPDKVGGKYRRFGFCFNLCPLFKWYSECVSCFFFLFLSFLPSFSGWIGHIQLVT